MESVKTNLFELCEYTTVNEYLLVALLQEEIILQDFKDGLKSTTGHFERASKLYTHIVTKPDAVFSILKTALQKSGNDKALKILNDASTGKHSNPSTSFPDNSLKVDGKSKLGENAALDVSTRALNNLETAKKCLVTADSSLSLDVPVSKSSNNSKPVYFGVPLLVHNFAGRDLEISELQKTLEESPFKYGLVCGLGGTGKTELVKKFAYDNREKHDVTWLEGDRDTSLSSSIKDLANHLGIKISRAENQDELQILKIISNHLSNFSNRTWLMIIDNVDETHEKFNSLIKFTLKIRNIFVVVTSQSRSVLNASAELIQVDSLLPKDAFDVVTKSFSFTTQSSAAEIETLCTTLHDFPLALQQAVAYILEQQRHHSLEKKFSIQDYLNEFECQQMNMFHGSKPLTDYEKTVLINWNLTLKRVQKQDQSQFPKVKKILKLLTFLDSDNIHIDFLFEIYRFSFKSVVWYFQKLVFQNRTERSEEEKKSFMSVITTLKNYSILKVADSYISIHRLVQKLSLFYLNQNDQIKILDTIIVYLNIDNLEELEIKHILSVWQHIQKKAKLLKKHKHLTVEIFNRLLELSLHSESLRFAENNVKVLKKTFGERDLYALEMEKCIDSAREIKRSYEEGL